MTDKNREPATVSLPSEREILVVRKFRAPQELVFDLWTEPRHIENWYSCPTLSLFVCDVDLRVGGRWRWGLRDASGADHTLSGEYRQIERPARLAFTEVYEPFPASAHDVVLTLDEQDGVTTMKLLIVHTSQAHRDGHLQAMRSGIQETYDRFEDELAELPRARAS